MAIEKRGKDGKIAKTALTKARDAAVAEAGGVEVLYGYVEAGLSMTQIADRIGLDVPAEKARWTIRDLLRRDSERYDAAKEASAEAHMQMAGAVYGDEAPTSTADAKWRNDRSGWHRWMAELRSGLREKGSVNVNVDIGQLHLDALRQLGSMPTREDPETVEADYVIEGESKPAGDPEDGPGGRTLGDMH